jgi:hypothetical protein
MSKRKINKYEEHIRGILDGREDAAANLFEEATMGVESTPLDYLLCMEEFLDQCHVYAFAGWEDAVIASNPEIQKYIFVCDMYLPKETDFKALERIKGKNKENQVGVKDAGDKYIVRFKILRRILDGITERNKAEAEKAAKIGPYSQQQDEEIPQEEFGGPDAMPTGPGPGNFGGPVPGGAPSPTDFEDEGQF